MSTETSEVTQSASAERPPQSGPIDKFAPEITASLVAGGIGLAVGGPAGAAFGAAVGAVSGAIGHHFFGWSK